MVRRLGLQESFTEEAAKFIRTCLETPDMTYRQMAEALNARGIRHYLGQWTRHRIAFVVQQLREGRIPGVPPCAPHLSYEAALRILHQTGATAPKIAAELRRQGFMTRHRRPMSATAVYHALRHLGLQSNTAARDQQLRAFLHQTERALSVREIARRVNALGFMTRAGIPWTENSMARRLVSLGLRTPKRRKRRHGEAHENATVLARQMILIGV
jgi:hypothetical protein